MGSIRRKLLFTLLFTELLAGIVAAWASFYTAQSQFDQFLDSELKQMATALAKRGNIPPSSLTLVGSNPEHRILVQVYESGSNSLFLSAKTSPFPILEREGFSDIQYEGAAWRVFTTTAGSEIIEVGQPESVRVSLAASASLAFFYSQPLHFAPTPIASVAARVSSHARSKPSSCTPSTASWSAFPRASSRSAVSPQTRRMSSVRRSPRSSSRRSSRSARKPLRRSRRTSRGLMKAFPAPRT